MCPSASPAFLDAPSVARVLGGEAAGNGVRAPGPGHSRFDRSLCVTLGPHGPDDFVVHSFAGDDWRECREHVRQRLGLPAWNDSRGKKPNHSATREPTQARSAFGTPSSESSRTALALKIWAQTRPLKDTIAETYLFERVGRRIDWPEDIRFTPECLRKGERLPALVVLLRDVRSNEPSAVQRIFLKPDGSDRLRDEMGKATLGPAAGTVAKLSPDESITLGLGITEGVEKGLSILAAGWGPIWATMGTSGMSKFPVLSGVEALTVFADADAAGQRAARECEQRWSEAGKHGSILTPKIGGRDWDDMLRNCAA